MNKQRKQDLVEVIQVYRHHIFNLTERNKAIEFGDVDSFLKFIQDRIEK
jgi:hypothetical protein